MNRLDLGALVKSRPSRTAYLPAIEGRRIHQTDASAVRLVTIVCALLYLAAILFAYRNYVSIQWGYFGFTYRPWGLLEYQLGIVLTVLGAAVLPVRIDRPSSIVLALLFLTVYVPTIATTLCLDRDRIDTYGVSLIALGVGFFLCCVGTRNRPIRVRTSGTISWSAFRTSMLLIGGFSAAILMYSYADIMRIVSLDNVYSQRFEGRDISSAFGLRHLQSNFVHVWCAFFLALGLVMKKWYWFLAGTLGCILDYSITAAKFAALLPVFFVAVHLLLSRRTSSKAAMPVLLITFAALTVLATEFHEDSYSAQMLAIYFVFRLLALPGLMFTDYFTVFSETGFTWWSHVKLISLVIPPPAILASDPLWPSIGHVVGSRVALSGEDYDPNANLFASDGIAAGGALGVLLISLALMTWLRLMDRASIGWNSKFVVLATLSFSVALTNGPFFTSLLSFGGIAWVLIWTFISPSKSWPASVRGE